MAQQMNQYGYALLLIVVSIWLFDANAQAADDAIALAAVPELGRLFTTPEQRLQLERALQQPTPVPPALREAAPASVAMPASATYGSLRRADRLIRRWP